MIANLAIKNAAPYWLVTQFFISGALFLSIGSVALALIDFTHISVLSMEFIGVIHLLLLGFVMSIIFGAIYQLLSVVLEVPVYSSQLGYLQFVMYIIGLGLFLTSLFLGDTQYITYGAIILYISTLIYVVNIFISLKGVKEWGIKPYFILFAHLFLAFGITYGLLISFELSHEIFGIDITKLIHKHAGITILGFVYIVILAISTILVPMFMLSHEFNQNISKPILIGSVGSIFMYLASMYLFASLLVSVVTIMFVYQMYDVYAKRVRKISDIYSYHITTSLVWIVVALGLFLYSYQGFDESILKLMSYMMIYGFLAFFLIGHIYKIVPFLVWNQKFAPLVGKQKIPMLADMLDDKMSYVEYYAKVVTLILLISTVFIDNSTLILFTRVSLIISALLFTYNVIYIFTFSVARFEKINNKK